MKNFYLKSKSLAIISFLIFLIVPKLLWATIGDLDPSFGGGDGFVRTEIVSGESSKVHSVVIDASGNVVVGGFVDSASYGVNRDFAIARYTSSGDLDTTFGGGDGIVITGVLGDYEYIRSVIIDASGNIVVGGYAHNGSDNDFVIARYTSSGDLDTTFGGGDGIVTTDLSGFDGDSIQSVIIDASGNIVVGGYTWNGSDSDFAIARYTSNGDLDTTFGGGDGIVTTAIGSANDYGHSVIIDSSGNIVVSGSANNGSDYDFAIARYTSNGDLDTTFGGGDGFVTPDLGGGKADLGYCAAIDSSGSIVVGGYVYNSVSGNGEFAVARYLTTETNNPPVANAGSDMTITLNGTRLARRIHLRDSGSSDPDGDTLTYAWSVVSVPSGSAITTASIAGSSLPATFVLADRNGQYEFMLTVTDPDGLSSSDNVIFNVIR